MATCGKERNVFSKVSLHNGYTLRSLWPWLLQVACSSQPEILGEPKGQLQWEIQPSMHSSSGGLPSLQQGF